MATEQNPLLAALPPVTDYFDYLTEIEPHINKENLLVLHDVLQDTKLTTNIGWDLVHPLLPLLPESEECLQDIARRGNPREVILKVTEALRILGFRDEDEDSDEEEDETQQDDDIVRAEKLESDAGYATASKQTGASNVELESLPLPILQFQTLLSMLSILHPRVKAKYPSRFLSTSLQAILSSYTSATSHFGNLTGSVIAFVKTLSGTKRPHLPPRQSSSHVPTASSVGVATDPEAQSDPPPEEEKVLMDKLLQAFVTHVMEEYLLHLSSDEDVPGLSWTSRVQEKLHPEMTVPGRTNFTERFVEDEKLQNRSLVVSQLMALGQDLRLSSKELYKAIIDHNEETGIPSNEDDPPSSAEDIPFSRAGSLYFFTARHVAKRLLDINTDAPGISIFPEHDTILQNFLTADSLATIGTENEALIDTVLVLGIIALEDGTLGEPKDDEQFTKYLQLTSLLSANCPSPTLRYHAHLLTSTLFRSYPSEFVRLSFIRDTLEHCPYENLKASAVGWLKGETLEANVSALGRPLPTGSSSSSGLGIGQAGTSTPEDEHSVFATPVALSTVAPFMFPDLTHDLAAPSLSEAYARFKLELSFYLAALNFYYLLLSAKPLHAILDIPGLHQRNDLGGSWLGPLKEASKRFREGLQAGGELRDEEGDEGVEHGLLDLRLLDDVLGRVDAGVVALN